jgi:hypothetical protein
MKKAKFKYRVSLESPNGMEMYRATIWHLRTDGSYVVCSNITRWSIDGAITHVIKYMKDRGVRVNVQQLNDSIKPKFKVA